MKEIIKKECPICKKEHIVIVEKEDLEKYLKEEGFIQDIFPYLSPSEREIIKTGVCNECWDFMFKDLEEEE